MNRFFTSLVVLAAVLLPSALQAKVEHLLPRPQNVELKANASPFALGRNISLVYEGGAQECVLLREFFEKHGCTVAGDGVPVRVALVSGIDGTYDYALYGYENEAYTLDIAQDGIEIAAVTQTGIIRAAQTLAQLAEGYEGTAGLEALSITDWPAFKLRGYMHDVGRSFIKIETLKKHVDLLSRFKVNTFHWHMTENQAWRFEVKRYPQLTEASTMTRFPGMYYTQEQCKELQDYAAERGVIVIPEIDMPGHSEAFVRAMKFDMQSSQGIEALKYILEEAVAVFDKAPYIHIGADEKNTSVEFLTAMTGKVHELGKKVVVWNPIKNVAVSAAIGTDMTQMWSTSGKVVEGMPNIDCRYNYTNHFDVFADLVGIYKSNIYYEQRGNANVAGTISAPWNDRKTATEEDIIRQNNFYANVLASAERAWIGGGKRYIDNCNNGGTNGGGGTTLPNSGDEYEEFASWERRFLFHKARSLKGEPIPYVKQTNVRWHITEPFPNNGNMNAVFAPEADGLDAEAEMKASYTHDGTEYAAGMATGAGIYLRHTWRNSTIQTYYGNRDYDNHTAYAWTYVYSDKEQKAGAQIEFQNYGRSEKDYAPDAGKWDRKGSDIWLNGVRIAPPAWENSGVAINDNEQLLKNENFTARKPVEVTLKKGWNKVFIKLPYVAASNVRLNKWMFTFVLTDLDGNDAVEGLVYSPTKSMDATADIINAEIAGIKSYVAANTGEQPGQYPSSLAAELNAVVGEVEATLGEQLGDEARAAQLRQLNEAFEAFKAKLVTAAVNQPKASDGNVTYYYAFSTPQRENRYPTSKGAGAEIIGEKTLTDAAKWKLVLRADGKLDIVNKADGTFVSPASGNDTALRTQAASPASGWEFKPAATQGLFIIVSGTTQFNQTNNNSLGYKVYNWGGGSNTTDTGCQYLIAEVEREGEPGTSVDELTDEERAEAAAFAEEFAGKTGYPADSEAAAYMTAVENAKSKADISAAKAALYSTTNVNVPADGKKYTLTMVAMSGSRYYLNYTGTDIAIVPRGSEELPATAVFDCEDNGNGTVSLRTADGKYLVYHSNYNGVDWLENSGNVTGLQEVKGAAPNSSKTTASMTDIRFEKIVPSTYVTGTSEQLFGLLSWYSLRGYDTGKSQDTYGYMVLKSDGSNYDGASGMFWNDNFSSAFLVEEVEAQNSVAELPLHGNDNAVYDLSGRKLQRIEAPGIYIVGGKKRAVR